MKCIETFPHAAKAAERQRQLAGKGIESRIMVDPLEGIYPALCEFKSVTLWVGDDEEQKAKDVRARAAS